MTRRHKPASTPQADEQEMVNLAVLLARKQMIEGTASAQVITHYLKLAATDEDLRRENLQLDIDLKRARIAEIEANANQETLYRDALEAMRRYSGSEDSESDF